jgi:hypothetical protein
LDRLIDKGSIRSATVVLVVAAATTWWCWPRWCCIDFSRLNLFNRYLYWIWRSGFRLLLVLATGGGSIITWLLVWDCLVDDWNDEDRAKPSISFLRCRFFIAWELVVGVDEAVRLNEFWKFCEVNRLGFVVFKSSWCIPPPRFTGISGNLGTISLMFRVNVVGWTNVWACFWALEFELYFSS